MSDGDGGRQPAIEFICRCSEVPAAEVGAAVEAGARTLDDVKRQTRAGMGACQGIYCLGPIAALLAAGTGVDVAGLAPMTARPPARLVTLAALAAAGDEERSARRVRM